MSTEHLPELGCCERHDHLRTYAKIGTYALMAFAAVIFTLFLMR